MNPIRRHLSYANVVATLALVFAMSGGALAAKHYLVNSTGQINPKVLKKLKGAGKVGPRGPAGPSGAPGVPGALGVQGSPGVKGGEGPAGLSALSTLPSGRTESGIYGIRYDNSIGSGFVMDAVTFPIPLPEPISASNVIYTKADTPVTHCTGPRHADPGFFCVYSVNTQSVTTPPSVLGSESGIEEGTSRVGALIEFQVNGTDAFDFGTYTVTAP
jgi:hypothetical protein